MIFARFLGFLAYSLLFRFAQVLQRLRPSAVIAVLYETSVWSLKTLRTSNLTHGVTREIGRLYCSEPP